MTWTTRRDATSRSNSPQSRLRRYDEYIPQIRCALAKLGVLFDALKARGLFEDAVIIVHGDHGSRIVQVEPGIANRDTLSRQDYHDAFSTLYAVKAPGVTPGYDTRMMALPELLRHTMAGDLDGSTTSAPVSAPSVFLVDQGKPQVREEVPMPLLPIPGK